MECNYHILYISPIDWFWIRQRPQQICLALAKSFEVDYFGLSPWKKDVNHIIMSNGDSLKKILKHGNLTIFRKKIIPGNVRHPLLKKISNALFLRPYFKKLFRKTNYDTIIITKPEQINFFPRELLDGKYIIADFMDNYSEFLKAGEKKKYLKDEKNLISCADKIITSSAYIARQLKMKYSLNLDDISVINNGVDSGLFNQRINIDTYETKEKSNVKVVGYVGAISKWFNFRDLIFVARSLPKVEFKIAGPIKISISDFDFPDNIKFVGSIPYDQVSKFISECNVMIMPFIINDLVKAVNPVKIYEYLALGSKIVIPKYTETQQFDHYGWLYSTKYEFLDKLTDALGANEDNESYKRRIDFAKMNSWEHRADEFKKVISKKNAHKDLIQ